MPSVESIRRIFPGDVIGSDIASELVFDGSFGLLQQNGFALDRIGVLTA